MKPRPLSADVPQGVAVSGTLRSVTVLVADTFEASGLASLRDAGCAVIYEPDLTDPALVERIRSCRARVLIVRSTRVTAAALEARSLALVVRAGAGYNTIDVAAASTRGIYVANCPGRNAVAVAELTLGLILAIDRHIPDNVADLRAGRWNKKAYSKARGLAGRTIGLLGFGRIGQEVARRAHAFDMKVLVWSRRFSGAGGTAADGQSTGDAVPIEVLDSPADLAARSDVLSIHLALTADTKHLVNAALLDRVRPGSYLINTARAELVDTEALARVVAERAVKVGLDVFDHEPSASSGAFVTSLAGLPGVYGTHHIGASTEQAQEATAAETVRIVLAFLRSGTVPNVVNVATKTPATHTLIVRHRDRPGVLAHVFEVLRHHGVNVQETENTIFEGAEAAVARVNVDASLPDDALTRLSTGNPDILEVSLVPIG